jgi:ParB-like chromosome segregation protein Spo0J/20S proteasome alpha/beta subunit
MSVGLSTDRIAFSQPEWIVTLLVGILCQDGVVIAADRQVSHGALGVTTVGTPGNKIIEIGGDSLFAFSGPVGLAQQVGNVFVANHDGMKGAKYFDAVPELQKILASIMLPALQTAREAAKAIGDRAMQEGLGGGLLAFPFQDGLKLVEINHQGRFEHMTTDTAFICVGGGKPNADPFIRFLWSVFWDRPPIVEEGALTAYWTVRAAIEAGTSGVGMDVDVHGRRWMRFELPDTTRPYVPAEVTALKTSIQAIGLQTPLTVVEREGRYVLVAGRHRLEALRLLKTERIPVRIVEFDDVEARLWTISENLHRAELTEMQRAQQIAEFAALSQQKREAEKAGQDATDGISGHVAQKFGPGRPEGGISQVARDLHISRRDVRRSRVIAGLSEEVKQAAAEHGLDDNQSALLDAARQPTSEMQIEALERRAQRKLAHDLVAHPLPAKDIARPLRDLTNLSAGEFARWIKITTPNDRPHVIRVLETAAAILRAEMGHAGGPEALSPARS